MNENNGYTEQTNGYPFDEIRSCLSSFPGIELVLLYGSYANGKARKTSDIDIAIAAMNPLGVEKRIELHTTLCTALKKEVDLVDLSTAEGVFLHRIMRDGKRVIETKKKGRELYLYYQKKALYFYADYYPIYRRDQDIRLKRIFQGGNHGS